MLEITVCRSLRVSELVGLTMSDNISLRQGVVRDYPVKAIRAVGAVERRRYIGWKRIWSMGVTVYSIAYRLTYCSPASVREVARAEPSLLAPY